jgi:MoxR-like ATPase
VDFDFTAFKAAFESHRILKEQEHIELLLEEQYKDAYDILEDAYNARLFVGIVGPVGCGKTTLSRKFALDHDIGFSWLTFSDLIRPSTLIGSFDPTLVFKTGYSLEAFNPGPLTLAALHGQIFLANELNRGEEYVLNTLLDVMEEKRLYIPQLKTWLNVDENFFFIAAMNPSDMRGTRVLPQALKDRIRVWINLSYPGKETELKIIQKNCPGIDLDEEVLTKIVDLIAATRTGAEVTQPASIRSSIGFARLLSQRAERLGTAPDKTMIMTVARLVMKEAISLAPGVDMDRYFHKLFNSVLENK